MCLGSCLIGRQDITVHQLLLPSRLLGDSPTVQWRPSVAALKSTIKEPNWEGKNAFCVIKFNVCKSFLINATMATIFAVWKMARMHSCLFWHEKCQFLQRCSACYNHITFSPSATHPPHHSMCAGRVFVSKFGKKAFSSQFFADFDALTTSWWLSGIELKSRLSRLPHGNFRRALGAINTADWSYRLPAAHSSAQPHAQTGRSSGLRSCWCISAVLAPRQDPSSCAQHWIMTNPPPSVTEPFLMVCFQPQTPISHYRR